MLNVEFSLMRLVLCVHRDHQIHVSRRARESGGDHRQPSDHAVFCAALVPLSTEMDKILPRRAADQVFAGPLRASIKAVTIQQDRRRARRACL